MLLVQNHLEEEKQSNNKMGPDELDDLLAKVQSGSSRIRSYFV
jgi:hypothetical protein